MVNELSSARDAFVSPDEFAQQLGVRVSAVRSWIRRGELPAVRLGRLTLIPRDALQRLLERRTSAP